MAPVSRSAQFAKVHKVLKKYYKPVFPPTDRPVLDHLLFACCLEDARYEAAEEAFAALVHTFYDWNEIRVTSISELSEVMAALPDSRAAANRVKRVLHGVFEELYSFDIEDTRKKNLGPTLKWFEKIDGSTKFSVAYVVQSALGGHSIPIDTGTMAALRVCDLASEKDAASGEVPGLERAIAKSKGIEFGSLLHQFGADYSANPFSPQVREILLAIDPECASRLPQRRAPREEKPVAAAPAEKKGAATTERPAAGKSRAKKSSPAADGDAEVAPPAEPKPAAAPPKPAADKVEKPEKKKPGTPATKKPAAAEPAPAEKPEKKQPAQADSTRARPTSEGLAKRKPR